MIKSLRNSSIGVLAVVASLLVATPVSQAVPTLQLDIAGGTYVGGTAESTFANSDNFQLAALLKSDGLNGDTFYIAVSLAPPATVSGDLGSFVFNGTTVHVTADMIAGTPNGLPPHGQFANFHKEFSFTFDLNNKAISYDVQDAANPHAGPVADPNGALLYALFNVDVSGLANGVEVHFDLYNKKSGSVDKFAPFSHDAESNVPEPTGFMLTAAGLGLFTLIRRRCG